MFLTSLYIAEETMNFGEEIKPNWLKLSDYQVKNKNSKSPVFSKYVQHFKNNFMCTVSFRV